MSDNLDAEFLALRSSLLRAPEGLVGGVWSSIAAIRYARAEARRQMPVQAVSVMLALGIGVAGGAMSASAMAQDVHEISVFSTHAAHVPSTLLVGQP